MLSSLDSLHLELKSDVRARFARCRQPRGHYKQYSPEQFVSAAESAAAGQASNSSARGERVPRASLQRHLRDEAASSRSDDESSSSEYEPAAAAAAAYSARAGAPTHLSAAAERRLVAWIEERHAASMPASRAEVFEQAAKLAVAEKNPFSGKSGLPSDKWYRGFLKRHPQLRIGSAESVPEAKTLALGDAEALTSLAAVLLPLMEKLNISGDRIFNFDESPFAVGNVTGGISKVVLSKNVGATGGNVKKDKKKSGFTFQSHVTAAVTVSATGEVFCPLLLVDKQNISVEESKGIPTNFFLQGTGAAAIQLRSAVWTYHGSPWHVRCLSQRKAASTRRCFTNTSSVCSRCWRSASCCRLFSSSTTIRRTSVWSYGSCAAKLVCSWSACQRTRLPNRSRSIARCTGERL
jgi:hypothetical protein